jgi:hypothetical protein
MKTIIVSFIRLLAGIGIGWHFGYTRAIGLADVELRGELGAYESGDAKAAAFAAEAVRCIDSDLKGAVGLGL